MELTRRDLLTRSVAGAVLGLGALRLLGDTLHTEQVCNLTCTQTLGRTACAA